MLAQLELSSAALGLLLSSFFWGYVITMIPGGALADRTSPVRVISWALGIVGVTAILTGLVENFTVLLVVRVVLGLAEGVIFPAFTVLFLKWFPNGERTRAVAATAVSVPLSSALAFPFGGWMIAQWDYTTMFVLQGAPAILMAVIFAKIATDDPDSDHRISASERELILANRDEETKAGGGIRDVLKQPLVWIVGVIFFLWLSGMYGFTLWLPSLVRQISSSGIQATGFLAAIPFVVGALGLITNAWLRDRTRLPRSWAIGVPLLLAASALIAQHFVHAGLVVDMLFLSIAGAWPVHRKRRLVGLDHHPVPEEPSSRQCWAGQRLWQLRRHRRPNHPRCGWRCRRRR